MKKHLLLVLMSAAVMFGCKENKTEPAGPALSLSKAEVTLPLTTKETLAVTAPSEYTGHANLKWISQNPKIASVDANGVVTALTPGKSVITAYVDGLNGARGECTVSVPAPKLKLSKNEIVMDMVGLVDLTYTYDKPLKTAWEVKMTTSDTVNTAAPRVKANIDPNELDDKKAPVYYDSKTGVGKLQLKALKSGVVNVTISNSIAGSAKDTVKIIVNPAEVTEFTLNYADNDEIAINSTDAKVEVKTITPTSFEGLPMKFKSLSPDILEVDATTGALTPKSVGNVIIEVSTKYAKENIVKYVTLKVVAAKTASKISFATKSVELMAGDYDYALSSQKYTYVGIKSELGDDWTVKVDDTYVPKDGGPIANIMVEKSSHENREPDCGIYADENSGTGTARIIVTSAANDKNGKPVTDTCLVTVNKIHESVISLKPTYDGIENGKKVQIKAYAGGAVESVSLIAPKGTVYEGKKLDAEKVIETITNPSRNSAGYTEATFAKTFESKVNNVAEYKTMIVRYKFKIQYGPTDFASYVIDKNLIPEDGAYYSPRR